MCSKKCSEMHRFEPGCELYVPIPEGMEQDVHWAGGEPVAVLNYHPEPEPMTNKGREDAMEKMRRWIENTYSSGHMREVVVH